MAPPFCSFSSWGSSRDRLCVFDQSTISLSQELPTLTVVGSGRPWMGACWGWSRMGNGYLKHSGCSSGVMKSFETGESWWWHNTVKALHATSVRTLKWSIVRYMNFTSIKKKKERILTNAWRAQGASLLPWGPRSPLADLGRPHR